jgi:hypothetical protein
MKLSDVVTQLALLLPGYTDKLSSVLSISSITVSGGVATIVTSTPHGLLDGEVITVADVETLTSIISVSKNGNIYTFTTGTDHDLTSTWPEHATVTLSGFTDGAWDAAFTLTGVPNRRNFKVRSANGLPVLSGSEVLHEIRVDGVNGRQIITLVNTTTFTYSGSFLDGDYLGGSFNAGVRVAGSVTLERADEQYTKQLTDKLWAFVVMRDAEVSKDRHSLSDATATRATGDDMRVRLIDGFSVFYFMPTSDDIMGVVAMDVCRHDLLLPTLKSVFGARFDTGLSGEADFRTVLTGHGFVKYNRAFLVYGYEFEFVTDLTNDDAVNQGDTRAFRDIDYIQLVGGDDTVNMIADIDLDDEPL